MFNAIRYTFFRIYKKLETILYMFTEAQFLCLAGVGSKLCVILPRDLFELHTHIMFLVNDFFLFTVWLLCLNQALCPIL